MDHTSTTGVTRSSPTTAARSCPTNHCATWLIKPHGSAMSTVVVTFVPDGNGRHLLSEAFDGTAQAIYLPELDDAARADALRNASAVLARTTRELRQGEIAL